MPKIFHDFDLKNFWEVSAHAKKEYVEKKPTPKLIKEIEAELGIKLPASYIELMQSQNGGIPENPCFPTKQRASWADNHIQITGIMGIGREKTYSLCGELGSLFMQEEWGYPGWGICICDTPSAGHDMVMLDYRKCGKSGEPSVVHVDEESDYKVTPLAENFEVFIRGLVNESVYDTSADDLQSDLAKIEHGAFSKLLARLIKKCPELDFAGIIRKLCRTLTEEKRCFALHADAKSYLMYDLQFFLYSRSLTVKSEVAFLDKYSDIMALPNDGEFTTDGYGMQFVEDWLKKRIAKKQILKRKGTLVFSDEYQKKLLRSLSKYLPKD